VREDPLALELGDAATQACVFGVGGIGGGLGGRGRGVRLLVAAVPALARRVLAPDQVQLALLGFEDAFELKDSGGCLAWWCRQVILRLRHVAVATPTRREERRVAPIESKSLLSHARRKE
jgi:hypothetical protein